MSVQATIKASTRHACATPPSAVNLLDDRGILIPLLLTPVTFYLRAEHIEAGIIICILASLFVTSCPRFQGLHANLAEPDATSKLAWFSFSAFSLRF